MARQRKGETAQEFLDRCHLLARRTVPCATDPVLQQAYNEQMLLSAFSKGLLGTPGRQVRFASPATAEEALRFAVTVSQAEIQEARDNAFYLDTEVADITPDGRVREPAVQHTTARQSTSSAAQSRKPRRVGQSRPKERASTSNGQPDKPVKCYECSCYGHFARDCANRRQKQADSNATPNVEFRAGQGKVNEQTPRVRHNIVHGRRSMEQALKLARDGRDESARHLYFVKDAATSKENQLDCLNAAPIVRAVIGGRPLLFWWTRDRASR